MPEPWPCIRGDAVVRLTGQVFTKRMADAIVNHANKKLQACKEAEAEAAAAAAAARKKKNKNKRLFTRNKKGKKKQPPRRRRDGRIRNGGTSLHGDLGDGKRWHFEMRGTPQAKRKLQEEIGEFEERHNLYGLRAVGLAWLVAEDGCEAQGWHFDYGDHVENKNKASLMIACSREGATFEYMDKDKKVKTINLRQGYGVMWGRKVEHRGSAYKKENVRLHAYIMGGDRGPHASYPTKVYHF